MQIKTQAKNTKTNSDFFLYFPSKLIRHVILFNKFVNAKKITYELE